MKKSFGQTPDLKMGIFPIWWHRHGAKASVIGPVLPGHSLFIGSIGTKVASLAITKFADDSWLVNWKIVQSKSEWSEGRIVFRADELRAAFGLTNLSGEAGDWLLARFGGDSAEQFKYIRWGNYLNIPCPGTGGDGDPNISIEISKEIQEAIRALLG